MAMDNRHHENYSTRGAIDVSLSVRSYAEYLVDTALASALKLSPQLSTRSPSSSAATSSSSAATLAQCHCSEIDLKKYSSTSSAPFQFTSNSSASYCDSPFFKFPVSQGYTQSGKMGEFIYFGAGPAKLPREVSFIFFLSY